MAQQQKKQAQQQPQATEEADEENLGPRLICTLEVD